MIAGDPASVAVPAGQVVLGARHWPGAPTGVPVLLAHGLASNARVWDGVAALLAAGGRQVLAVDLRGHGTSASVPDPPGSDPILVAACDLAWVCASLHWPRVVVVGHSWGANIALQLSADCPHLVAGLALVDGGWLHESDRWGDDLDVIWRTKAPPDLTGWDLDAVREVLTGAHPDWSGQAVEATLANLQQRPDGTLRPWLTPGRHRARWASLLAHRPRELHRRVRCPTVLLAAGDPPDEPTRQAASVLPAAELLTFPSGEHDLHLQFPDQVGAAIARIG
jgi:pimeloyl-ACP methyl ester carboxylesterase